MGSGSVVVAELEGGLLKSSDPFPYFMLVAFEASGLIRFALLLLSWPVVKFLEFFDLSDLGLRMMIFISVAGVRESEIEAVSRAVLPKFYMDDVDMEAWAVYSGYDKRVVMSKCPRVMVERFVKDHLRADEVVGGELVVNKSGVATGFIKMSTAPVMLNGDRPVAGLGRGWSGLDLCKVRRSISIWFPHLEHHTRPFTDHRKLVGAPGVRAARSPSFFHDVVASPPTDPPPPSYPPLPPIGILLASSASSPRPPPPDALHPYMVGIFGGASSSAGRAPASHRRERCAGHPLRVHHRTSWTPSSSPFGSAQASPPSPTHLPLSEILPRSPPSASARDRRSRTPPLEVELANGDLVGVPRRHHVREPFLLRLLRPLRRAHRQDSPRGR
ncbi:uncharacterized protein A4U43_C02F1130 [Asparagus officinalis]|uniref:Glycerol-3-phosphate acyltransferase RAM2/GPAT1-8 HAD-like domain-containing protein n=1 Tax=Asparagus officinalis TaxID=4686 RepID=A0A5P1FHL0_ASPOF|nr:uncharacterized protein A4U43_C02F1130 [Asparagus officinalis]